MRISPTRKTEGSLVPTWLKLKGIKEICQGAKLCYAELLRHAYSGQCFPRIEVLAKELGVNRKQAQRYIKTLKDLKLIEIEEQPGHSNRYYFLLHEWMIDECQDIKSIKKCPKECPPLDQVFKDGLKNRFDTPLAWNSWREVSDWNRRNLSIRKLKEKLKERYDHFLGELEKGKKLKMP